MAVWNSRGLRGSVLEDIINITIEKLRQQGLALIQKIPTPITPIEIDKASRHITLAYFDKKSTVDYIGVVQGVPVCFDAKECASDTFALQNVHEHQVEFMRDFERQEGIAFLVIYFSHIDKYYYMWFSELDTFWKRQQEGGRKSFRRDELDERYYIGELKNNILPFLNRLQDDMDER
ncbi:MAG: Holliday junction resolvase RecU [Lachnospiraceae bacterium]|nr:Holliday junction resolvase RecU [Lachnospiraceae bacterium]